MPTTNSQAAALGRLSIYAMDMLASVAAPPAAPGQPAPPPPTMNPLTPPVDARIAKEGWDVLAYLVACDAVLGPDKRVVCGAEAYYGFVAKRHDTAAPPRFVAVVRGTAGIVEWVEDAEFVPVPHPRLPEATVEQGFWSIYAGMRLIDLGGQAIGTDAASGITAAIAGAPLTVVGHSLGSALSTYLVYDLTMRGVAVDACLFASPQTGDSAFVQAFDRAVADYRVFNYSVDVVPRVPMGLGYETLPRATVLQPSTAEASVRFSVFCNHHVVCYCAMLDYEATMTDPDVLVTADDQACAACILGPETGAPTIAKVISAITHV